MNIQYFALYSSVGTENVVILIKKYTCFSLGYLSNCMPTFEPAHVKRVLITYATSEGSGERTHPRSLARAFAVRSHNIGEWRKLQTTNRRSGPTG